MKGQQRVRGPLNLSSRTKRSEDAGSVEGESKTQDTKTEKRKIKLLISYI